MFGIGSQMPSKNVDIVFCIDGTGSMTPCIDNVRENALKQQQQNAIDYFNNEIAPELETRAKQGLMSTHISISTEINRDMLLDYIVNVQGLKVHTLTNTYLLIDWDKSSK